MDHAEFLRRPAVIRGLGGAQIYPFRQSDQAPLSNALKTTTDAAVKQLVDTAKTMENAGTVGQTVNALQDITQTSPMTTGTEPAPGAVNATNSAATTNQTPVGVVGLKTDALQDFLNKLPPIVAGPLKWAPAIGLGLYLGGHHKAGLIVGGLGVARWAIRRGYFHA